MKNTNKINPSKNSDKEKTLQKNNAYHNSESNNNKSSRTIFNNNPTDHIILNSTKEEEDGNINNFSFEEFKLNMNNKLIYLEMQLKEKANRIKNLENALDKGILQSNNIQKSKSIKIKNKIKIKNYFFI